jgi:hypothetical protein
MLVTCGGANCLARRCRVAEGRRKVARNCACVEREVYALQPQAVCAVCIGGRLHHCRVWTLSAVTPQGGCPGGARPSGRFPAGSGFGGSFAGEPLTLTEEVAAREDAAWVVDFSLTQSEKVDRLRVRFDVQSGQAVSAAHFDGGHETPAKLSEYDALVARTVYAADVNDGLVSANEQTCLVGADELDCETKTYKVWVGDAAATLSVVHSNTFADRDVSGEITTADGKLIYRAELVEAKQGKPTLGVAAR